MTALEKAQWMAWLAVIQNQATIMRALADSKHFEAARPLLDAAQAAEDFVKETTEMVEQA